MSVPSSARLSLEPSPREQAAPLRYKLLDKIGRGGFGFVYRALDLDRNRIVAAKLIDLEEAGDEMEDVQHEIAVMSSSHCPQLTEYYTSFVSENQLWIVMEHLEAGSLSDIMKDFGPLSEQSCAYVIKELLLALVYLHKSRKIHRDIKAGNILVSGSGLVKLSDFGVTGQLTDSMNKRKTRVGTPFWMAPEVITETSYDENADIWSVGITAIELAKGFPPHAQSMHPMQVIFLIPKKPPPQLEGNFSPEFKSFVATCLQKDPTQRPSSSLLLHHPFLARTKLTDELKSWASERVRRQEEQLKALELTEQARQLVRRQGSPKGKQAGSRKSLGRDGALQAGGVNISELMTLDASRPVDRPTTHFEYLSHQSSNISDPSERYAPPPPSTAPIKRSSPGSGSVRGLGRDPLATALAAANAAAALSVANSSVPGSNINITGSVSAVSTNMGGDTYLSPRSECDVSYSYSMESGHDGDSNNTSGWDFDLTIKTRASTGSQYSYSYSGKNFPDADSLANIMSEVNAGTSAAMGRSVFNPSSGPPHSATAKAILEGTLKRVPSMESSGGSSGGGNKDQSVGTKGAESVAKAKAYGADEAAGVTEMEDEDASTAVVIEEDTIRQYLELDPPMTDAEAFSCVVGVLDRFKWQFVDREPPVRDMSSHQDAAQKKTTKRIYRDYIKQLDATMARNPGGVEYSRENPLRPSSLFKEVVVPAMGSVGSAAAVVLGSDLNGGGGYKGLGGRMVTGRASVEGNELPVTPISSCAVVDLMAEGAMHRSAPKSKREGGASRSAPPPLLAGPERGVGSRSIDSSDDLLKGTVPPSISLSDALQGCCVADDALSPEGGALGLPIQKVLPNDRDRPQISPRAHLHRSNGASTCGEGGVYQSADALLNHLCTTAGSVSGLTSPRKDKFGGQATQPVSVVEMERCRDRESRAILWALERCLLALDIQSSGGATSEVLSSLIGYMMEEMEGDGEEAGGDIEEV